VIRAEDGLIEDEEDAEEETEHGESGERDDERSALTSLV
jgi:hypothetical protein